MTPEFLDMLHRLDLDDAARAIDGGQPVVSVRHNPRKPSSHAVGGDRVPWCGTGEYLAERPVFALDPAWHQGRYYVQEGSSMFVSHVVESLGLTAPVIALDACAAPGGKTTALIDALPAGSLVVANEYVPARAAVLRENIVKWGYPGTIVTRGDTAAYTAMDETFDLILADVPCSGEGMMRKDAEAVAQWTPGLVQECAARQREIIGNLWPALRPGGILIYSTCTLNTIENERMVSHIMRTTGAESVPVDTDSAWGITPAWPGGIPEGETPMHAYRFIPGRTRGEGLFMAVLRKPGQSSQPSYPGSDDNRKRKGGKGKETPVPREAATWIAHAEDYDLFVDADRVSAFPRRWKPILNAVRKHVDVIHEGIHVATLKGRDVIPAHGLVMSEALNGEAFPHSPVDRDTALAYLRGESPRLPDGTPRGYVTLTYDDTPLGLVKNLGNRSNSLYPQPWRLRI